MKMTTKMQIAPKRKGDLKMKMTPKLQCPELI